MYTLTKWQKVLKEAAYKKFPNNKQGTFDRVTSLQEQLDDIKMAISVENGITTSNNHAHQDVDHRIGALIADALIFAEERGANMENELGKVLAWFENNDTAA